MHALLTRWMSRSPCLSGSAGSAVTITLPHAVARRDLGRAKRLAPVVRRLEALPAFGPAQADSAPGSSDGVSLRVDPSDQRRTRISGRMDEVCDALDALIRLQQA